MDQRGTGQSEPIQCVKAAAAFYQSAYRPQVPAERDQAAKDAQTFATDCVTESGVAPADLPYYATKQAVEDLEAVRDYLGADKLELYGESYGTQYVQTYAAAHPDRIQTLYLDGAVDLTVDGPTYYTEAARSATDTLVATLDACTAEATCKGDVRGGDALAVYDALAARLAERSDHVRLSDGGRHDPAAPAHGERARVRQLLLPLQPRRARPARARDRGRVARRLRAARQALLRQPQRRPGHAPAGPGPDLVGRGLLRRRVPGLRLLPNDRRVPMRGSVPGSTVPRRPGSTTCGSRPPTTATCPASIGRAPRRRTTVRRR